MLDSIDAEKEFPLLVSYPAGGWLSLLVWYAEHEGNNLIAAAGQRSVLKVYAARLKKENGDAKPMACWDARLVCPPAPVRAAAAREGVRRDFDHVTSSVGFRLRWAQEKDPKAFAKTFPNISKCQKRRPKSDKEHWLCPACLHGMAIAGYTRESFYLAKRKDPDLAGPKPKPLGPDYGPPKPDRFVSRAPEADLSRPIYVVSEEFGHHCKGISICEVDLKSEWLGAHRENTKFFFQGTELAVPPVAVLMHKQYIDKHAAAEEARKVEFRTRRAEEEREDAAAMKRLLT